MTHNAPHDALRRNIARLIAEGREPIVEIPTNDALIARAEALGTEHGRAAGSWVIDGNTTPETARAILAGYDDGDPEVMDMMPAPLSGEWVDGVTPSRLVTELEINDESDDGALILDVCDAYERGFSDGYWAEVIVSAQSIA
jgi:hypothetical protein